MSARLLLALALLLAAAPAAAETLTIHYLERPDDARYVLRPVYGGLTLRVPHRPVEGAREALADSRVLTRRLGIDVELAVDDAAPGETAADAVRRIGGGIVLLDLPAPEIAEAARALRDRPDLLLFNVGDGEASLRRLCTDVLLSTAPSRAMLTDALAQYLLAMTARNVLVIAGQTPEDAADAEAFAASAGKFGLKIVDSRSFVASEDPRDRDRNDIALLTAGSYDVIYLADSVGDFGRFVAYAARGLKPVVGSEGLTPTAWDWTWERHGGPQLNDRFERLAGRHMTGADYGAWAAVRASVEAVSRTGGTDVAKIRGYLLSPAFRFDTYKEAPGSFRPWSRQLRQPILLAMSDAVVAAAPIEGFLHPLTTLDTLGTDRPEFHCE